MSAATTVVVVPKPKNAAWEAAKPFVTGGISACIATACIQPIDMVKVRLQLSGEGGTVAIKNPITMTKLIISEGGVAKLYSGLGAALLRQVTYGTARLGIFRTITDRWTEPGKPLEFWKRAAAGLTAGGVGAFIGVPADLALIRMQADSTLPLDQRRNYRGVFHALSSIIKSEGFSGLFAGCIPTITRAMAVNCGMLATYDQSKDFITKHNGPGKDTNFYASMIAGFFASAASLPFDFVKTRVQKQRAGPDGILPYKNGIDCAVKVFKSEGPLAFYKGFATYYVRIAPHAVIALNVLDYLNAELKARGL